MPETLVDCPKHMEYGPCGGVEFDGSCEVSPHRCVFLDLPTVRWHGAAPSPVVPGRGSPDSVLPDAADAGAGAVSAGAVAMRARMRTGPVVVADFPARALDAASIAECGQILSGSVDAELAGDAGSARVQFPPAYRATLIHATGLQVWSGFTCRDRNRVAMEGELAALAHVGVAGVHCVTGDHTRTGSRPDAAPVFDLDSTQSASLAASRNIGMSSGLCEKSPSSSNTKSYPCSNAHLKPAMSLLILFCCI